MDLLRKIFRIALLLFLPMGASAQDASVTENELSIIERNAQMGFNDTIDRLADDFIEASVLIADQGYELFSVFGHMALRLRCETFDKDFVYTYEGERIEDRVFTFLKGDLKMGVFAIPAQEYIDEFESGKKGLTEYMLHLSPEQKIRLWEVVDAEMMANQEVTYDLFKHGCAARVRDWVTLAVQPERIVYTKPLCTHDMLIADIFFKHTAPDWAQFPIATIGGGPLVYGNTLTDLQRLVAPRDLVYEWKRATVNDVPLLSEEGVRLAQYIPIKKTWFSPFVFALVVLLLCVVNLWVSVPYLDWIFLTAFTIMGCVIVFAQYFHPMSVIGWTWLAIPFNPLPAIFWRWREKWGMVFMAIVLLWVVVLVVVPHKLTTNAHLLLALAFGLICAKSMIRNKMISK